MSAVLPDHVQRLFVALPVAQDLSAQLQDLPHNGFDGKWLHPDDFHITLRFLGDITHYQQEEVIQALERVRRAPFHIEVGGLGQFHMGGKRTVLWAAVRSTRKLTALVAEINEKLAPLGFEMPNKPYVPHITLARLKAPRALETYIKKYESAVSASWQVGEFYLYESKNEAEKPHVYNRLSSFALRP